MLVGRRLPLGPNTRPLSGAVFSRVFSVAVSAFGSGVMPLQRPSPHRPVSTRLTAANVESVNCSTPLGGTTESRMSRSTWSG